MHTVRRRVLALAAMLGTALAAFAVEAAPAQAVAPPCQWGAGEFGTHSNCDEQPAYPNYCVTAADLPYQATIRGPGGIALANVWLGYIRGERTAAYPNGTCRVAFAGIQVYHESAACYAKVERTSDRQAYRVGGAVGYFLTSQVVYDAGVSSYAWGYCSYNGSAYTAGTPSY